MSKGWRTPPFIFHLTFSVSSRCLCLAEHLKMCLFSSELSLSCVSADTNKCRWLLLVKRGFGNFSNKGKKLLDIQSVCTVNMSAWLVCGLLFTSSRFRSFNRKKTAQTIELEHCPFVQMCHFINVYTSLTYQPLLRALIMTVPVQKHRWMKVKCFKDPARPLSPEFGSN